MSIYPLLFSYDRFSGINNVEKSFRIPTTRDAHWNRLSDMQEMNNLDIDNTMALSSRPGSTLQLSGSDIHSLWSDGKLTCMFMDGSALYKLLPQYTSLLLGTIGKGRMSYAPWNDRVYMTNDVFIGYVQNDTLSGLADPGMTYKLPLPPGKFIAYYRSRLYVAKGNVLYISDPIKDFYDIRTGFRVFSNNINMLISVERGLYISDGVTWFMPGLEPDEFRRDQVFDSDVIPYTAININGELVNEGILGKCAIWTSVNGICLGDGEGKVKNLTRHRYAMDSYGIGGAIVRNLNETVHYIATLE